MTLHEHGGMEVTLFMLKELQSTLETLSKANLNVKEVEVQGHTVLLRRKDDPRDGTDYVIIGIRGVRPTRPTRGT